MKSYALGAFQSWLVQYADFGGAAHPSRHTNEERAKMEAEMYLRRLLHHLEVSSSVGAVGARRSEFTREAQRTIVNVTALLGTGNTWAAYQTYKEFEEEWNERQGHFPLTMSIGTMRVIPDPVPEIELH